ncbi:Alanyl-tRNA editing protein Aarsd1 [Grifola frondosa]|uniref:Alanyl-tRNA editing protein Aarsd1 n=1 Tax=Grifola frondosa TaxID=5627 RepID=A0A1C7MJR5_GRIFR|nr:Alanyl-tRNA editing protein Aarsd1 [Grifola frondosa]
MIAYCTARPGGQYSRDLETRWGNSLPALVSETLNFQCPSPHPRVPIPVGLLACQRDPLLRELSTPVVSCRVSESSAVPSNGRKSKKDKSSMQASAQPLLEVVLHDTILFPEGGGQPSDIGTLTSADDQLWDVVEVKRHERQHALQFLIPGMYTIVQLGEDGFKRRYDHMCMHTSQHLLSAVLEARLNLPTLSWCLTAFPSPCYVEIPRGMSLAEITLVQDEANKFVFEGRSVHVEVEEFDRNEIPEVAKDSRSTGKGVPADYTGGIKRTVVIDGVDRNLCCGTQLPSLHNLQLFIFPHTDALSRSSTTSARLYFLSGPRLLAHLASANALLTSTAATMSCGAPEVPERVEQVVEERKRATKRTEDVEAELAAAIARDILREAGPGKIVVHRHRTDDATNALGFLSSISSAFANELGSRPEVPSHLVVLSSSPSAQTMSGTTVIMIFASDEKVVKEVGEGLKGKLNIKGGGKGTRWSGKFTGVWKEGREGLLVQEVLKSVNA